MFTHYGSDFSRFSRLVCDHQGLGKTIQTISLLCYLLETKNVRGPHMIIAPKAVLSNWVNECREWAPGLTAILYDGYKEDRKDMKDAVLTDGRFNVLLTHYDLVIRDKSVLQKARVRLFWFCGFAR